MASAASVERALKCVCCFAHTTFYDVLFFTQNLSPHTHNIEKLSGGRKNKSDILHKRGETSLVYFERR